MKILKYSEDYQNVTQNTKRVYAIGEKCCWLTCLMQDCLYLHFVEEKWIICKAQKGDMQLNEAFVYIKEIEGIKYDLILSCIGHICKNQGKGWFLTNTNY